MEGHINYLGARTEKRLLVLFGVLSFLSGFAFFYTLGIVLGTSYSDRTGNTSGIAAVITALGVVCFALSFINSAKATKERGILLEDVISKCYPYYGWIFLFHGGFALLGLYSCAEKILLSSWICLVGIVLCTIYSVKMAYYICFSKLGRERLIDNYIKSLLRFAPTLDQRMRAIDQTEPLFEQEYNETHNVCRRAANQLGYYIGERYQADDIRIESVFPLGTDESKEDILLSTLQLLMGGDWSSKEWEGPLPIVFDKLFSSHLGYSKEDMRYEKWSLYDLPGIDGDRIFWEDVKHCVVLWDNLLRPVKHEARQAELVMNVLRHSPKTAVLCCSLIWHLYNIYVQDGNSEQWTHCARFLQLISNITRSSNEIDNKTKQCDKVLRCCMDMMLVFYCLTCILEANSVQPGEKEIFAEKLRYEKARNSSSLCYISGTTSCAVRYLYYAKKLFWMLAIPEASLPSRAVLYKQIPHLITMIERCFGQN